MTTMEEYSEMYLDKAARIEDLIVLDVKTRANIN